MGVQLDELIERIKREGVKSAEEEASRVRERAEKESGRTIADAREEAKAIVEKAQAEAERFEATAREGVRQAARDAVLDLRQQLTRMMESILGREVAQSLSGQVVADGLAQIFSHWTPEGGLHQEVLVPEKSWDQIRDLVAGRLAEQMKKGLELRPSGSVRAGFRIQEKDGGAYYDFTDRGLTEFLMEYLNPKLAETLDGEQA